MKHVRFVKRVNVYYVKTKVCLSKMKNVLRNVHSLCFWMVVFAWVVVKLGNMVTKGDGHGNAKNVWADVPIVKKMASVWHVKLAFIYTIQSAPLHALLLLSPIKLLYIALTVLLLALAVCLLPSVCLAAITFYSTKPAFLSTTVQMGCIQALKKWNVWTVRNLVELAKQKVFAQVVRLDSCLVKNAYLHAQPLTFQI